MKTLKFIFAFTLMFVVNSDLCAQKEWNTRIEWYGGDEYIIESTDGIYAVTNKKYDLTNVSTRDIEYDGESMYEWSERKQELVSAIGTVTRDVLEFDKVPPFQDDYNYHITVVCFFDSYSKDYVGAYFIFDTELWGDVITLQKLHQLEFRLLQAKINAGETNLLDPHRPFFTFSVNSSVHVDDDE
jgi:hypothetical protein